METKRDPSARYSTKEIAARLFLSEQRTRHLLFAHDIPHTRAGAAYLWDGSAVDRLIALLGKGGGA